MSGDDQSSSIILPDDGFRPPVGPGGGPWPYADGAAARASGIWLGSRAKAAGVAIFAAPGLVACVATFVRHGQFAFSSTIGVFVAGTAAALACVAVCAFLLGKAFSDGTGNKSVLAGMWLGAAAGYVAALLACVLGGLFLGHW